MVKSMKIPHSTNAQNESAEPVPTSGPSPIHVGHRNRLRRRARNEGLEHFEPHQVIELILCLCIPRKDVNETAHALIDRFGSVAGVLDASEEELQTVRGIGAKTAFFLHVLPAVFRRYACDSCPVREPMDTAEKMTTYLCSLYIGEQQEKAYLVLFDNALHLLDCTLVGEGSINSVSVNMRRIIELALRHEAGCAVLVHNHPNGPAYPSTHDREMTDYLIGGLDMIGVPLLEHFLLSQGNTVGILRKSRGLLRASPRSMEPDEAFWRRFYGEVES